MWNCPYGPPPDTTPLTAQYPEIARPPARRRQGGGCADGPLRRPRRQLVVPRLCGGPQRQRVVRPRPPPLSPGEAAVLRAPRLRRRRAPVNAGPRLRPPCWQRRLGSSGSTSSEGARRSRPRCACPRGVLLWSSMRGTPPPPAAGRSIPERDAEGRLYNTCLVFNREGKRIGKHRKARAARRIEPALANLSKHACARG